MNSFSSSCCSSLYYCLSIYLKSWSSHQLKTGIFSWMTSNLLLWFPVVKITIKLWLNCNFYLHNHQNLFKYWSTLSIRYNCTHVTDRKGFGKRTKKLCSSEDYKSLRVWTAFSLSEALQFRIILLLFSHCTYFLSLFALDSLLECFFIMYFEIRKAVFTLPDTELDEQGSTIQQLLKKDELLAYAVA